MGADDYAARQILSVFTRYNVAIGGVLRRHQFFEVRDSDFQRGIDAAVVNGWIARHHFDRYRYVLLAAGRKAGRNGLTPTAPGISLAQASPQPQANPNDLNLVNLQ